MNQTAKNLTKPEPFVLERRIGSTTFKVNVHFSETSGETLKEKSLRLMKNELLKNDLNFIHKNSNMKPLQADWLSERGSL